LLLNCGHVFKTPISYRKWCKACGGHLFTEHPTMGLVDIYAAMIPRLTFESGVHVHYQETALRIPDGKPKMKDMPKEMGGARESPCRTSDEPDRVSRPRCSAPSCHTPCTATCAGGLLAAVFGGLDEPLISIPIPLTWRCRKQHFIGVQIP